MRFRACLPLVLLLPVLASRQEVEEAVKRPDPVVGPLYEVVTVVDGDTIHVSRDGKREKLRLLAVDTEEKLLGRPPLSPSKPETLFGQETTGWAKGFFDALVEPGETARVGLRFPNGREQRDIYGRLLCHVLLPDGRDFNLLLVELGKSPYFNKYGNSLICHEELVAAQERARRAQLGIWNPYTNESQDPKLAASRPYDRLLPWWQLRADAVEDYRAKHAQAPGTFIASDDPEALQSAFESGAPVQVFGEVGQLFEEEDGSLTVLFRSGDKKRSLRAAIPKDERGDALERLVNAARAEFRQNYLWIEGRIVRGPRGFRIESPVEQWRIAARKAGR